LGYEPNALPLRHLAYALQAFMAGFRADVDSRITGISTSRFDGSTFEDVREERSARSHPALWKVEDLRENNTVKNSKVVAIGDFRATGTVGYTGFIPGKVSENVVQKTITAGQLKAKSLRPYDQIPAGRTHAYDTLYDRPSGRKSLTTIVASTDMTHSNAYSAKLEGIASHVSLIKDHDVPNSQVRSFADLGEASSGYCGYVPIKVRRQPETIPLPKAILGRAVAGYGGFIPGRVVESVFGGTSMRVNAKAMKTRPYLAHQESEAPAKQHI
jgi:hypothetical protein